MKSIFTTNAPTPAGHYSQAIVHNDLVFVSGILPITPDGQKLSEADLSTQAQQVFANLKAILETAGTSPDKVIKTTIFITDVSFWGAINALYAEFFGEHRPARSIVPIKDLHYGLLLELEAIAVL